MPVQLIASGQMVQHFRHEKGVATQASCDLYVASRGSYYEQLLAGQLELDSVSPFSISLGLLVFPDRSVWSLQVAIRSEKHFAVRVVAEVGGRLNHIDIAGKGKAEVLLADPSHLPYRILSVNNEIVEDSTDHSTPGISKTLATAFGPFGKIGGRAVHRATKFIGGKSYALVWPMKLTVAIPQEVLSFYLDEVHECKAAIISIPENVSDELEDWLVRTTGLQYEPGHQSISLLWPPPIDSLTSSHMVLSNGNSVLLHINGGHRGEVLSAAYEFDSGEVHAISIEDDGIYFADLGAAHSANFTSPDEKATIFLELKTLQVDAGMQVIIEFEIGRTTTFSLSTFDPLAEYWMNEVRHGKAYIRDIFLPPGALAVVSLRLNGLWTEVMRFSENNIEVPTRIGLVSAGDIDKLLDVMKNSNAELLVDLGVFGRLTCAEIFTLKKENEVKLSRELRNKILFYLSQHPANRYRAQSQLHQSDLNLIKEFHRCAFTSETLAIRNFIANALALN